MYLFQKSIHQELFKSFLGKKGCNWEKCEIPWYTWFVIWLNPWHTLYPHINKIWMLPLIYLSPSTLHVGNDLSFRTYSCFCLFPIKVLLLRSNPQSNPNINVCSCSLLCILDLPKLLSLTRILTCHKLASLSFLIHILQCRSHG